MRTLTTTLAALLLATLPPLPTQAHTSDAQNLWLEEWLLEVEAAGALTVELVDEYREFWDRHQIVLPPQRRYTLDSNVEQWRGLVEGYFPAEAVDTMMCLMGYESGGDPRAKNPTSAARGLFQIMASIWSHVFGVSYDDLYDPDTNIRLAAQIYERQGYGAWQPYGRGLCHGL